MTTIKALTKSVIQVLYRFNFFALCREVFILKGVSSRGAAAIGLISLFALLIFPLTASLQTAKPEITEALQSGDTTRAVSLIENEIKLDPSNGYNYFLLGKIHETRGQLPDAEKQYQLSFDKDGKFYQGLYALGLIQLKLNKVDAAEKSFSLGLKKSKDMKAAFNNGMGLVYMAKGDYNSADRAIRQAIILDSLNAEYHINLGDVNYMMKVYPLALAEYETALKLDTASLDVYFHMAEACLELKDYTCALEKLKIVLTRDSTHADAWMRAGGIYYRAALSSRNPEDAKRRFMETIGAYKKFIELTSGKPDSTTGRAFYETGMAYMMIGGYQEANTNFATVLSIPVEPKDIYFYRGRAFLGMSQFDSALVNFNKHVEWVAKQGPDFVSGISNDELYRRFGEAYENMKDYANAVDYYRKSLEIDSTQDRVLYSTAICYNYLGDYRNALIYYMKRIALGIDERFWSIYYNAATCAMYLAEKESQMLAQGGDEPIDGMPVSADPLEGVNLPRLAADYLEKVLEYKSDNIKAQGMLASIYLYQLSECPKGTALFEKVLAAEPDNCDALKSLGYASFAGLCAKNFSRAIDYLNRAYNCGLKKGNAACSDVNLMLWIAQAYHFRAIERRDAKQKEESKQDFKAANEWYTKVTKCDPGNTAARDGFDNTRFEF